MKQKEYQLLRTFHWGKYIQYKALDIKANFYIYSNFRLPDFELPRISLLPYVLYDALEIAAVCVALHLSMCKVFNRKLGTRTCNNQELYALGFMGTLSSPFGAYPITTSLGRSMLNVECGVKTQVSI